MIAVKDNRRMAIGSANVAIMAMRRAAPNTSLTEQVSALAAADTYLKRALQQLTEARSELAEQVTDTTE
jgi:hypothetical protein